MLRLTRWDGPRRTNLIVLIIFGVAFGFVEAAVVYYLRNLVHFDGQVVIPHYRVLLNLGFITFVSPVHTILLTRRISDVEVFRESATIVMLACVAYIAATKWLQRLGAFLVCFACWDLAYYLFLRIVDNWPRSFLTRDVFFLIPVTWIGPVITPMVLSIAILLLGSWIYLDPSSP